MKIVNSEIAMEAALERRYMERLRERVRSRVELEARLLRSVQESHRDFADAVGAATSQRSEAGRVAEIFVDSFEEQKIQREIDARVDARLNAMGAYTGLDTQSPAVIGERLARGELRYEPETEARERFRAMARQANRGTDRTRMWSLDRDRYIDLQASEEATIEREDAEASPLSAGALADRDSADPQAQSDEQTQWPEDPREALPSGNLRTRDGQEIEASARQRKMAQRSEGQPSQRTQAPFARPQQEADDATAVDDASARALEAAAAFATPSELTATEPPAIAGASGDYLRARRVLGQATSSEPHMLWMRAQQAYRQWH